MMDERTERSPRARKSNSPKNWNGERRYSGDLVNNAEISNDEDDFCDNDEYENEDYENVDRVNTKSPSSNTSYQESSSPDNRHARSAQKSSLSHSDIPEEASTCENPKKRSRPIGYFVIFATVLVLVAAYALKYQSFVPPASPMTPEQEIFKKFENDLGDIKKKFPQQNRRSWSDIQAGMMEVIHSSLKPWTFVLFSNETAGISCLAELLGAASSKALQTNDSLILRPKDMGKEYGDTIDRLRPLIMEKKAVVVHDLLNIDPGAIQAFHTMCDRENPLVNKAVYILTIIAPGYTSSQKPEVFVENILTDRFFNKIHMDKLQPLIAKLTDGPIISVEPGKIPTGCIS